MKPKYIIITAGGRGTRMGTEMPKQFLHLDGKPVLMHTIEAFYNYDRHIHIIVVIPADQQSYWHHICNIHNFKINHNLVSGGETRFHSVKNGLDHINAEDVLIGIHDGVRPVILKDVIARCYETANEKGSAFPVIPIQETLRKRTSVGSFTVDRTEYCLVQTPQVFHSGIIKKAYLQEYSNLFTDDVSVVEALGEDIVYEVEGSRINIKITNPMDLEIAEILKKNMKQ